MEKGFWKRIYHIFFHTEIEMHILDKKQSFKPLRDGTYEKKEVVSSVNIQGPDIALPEVFVVPRKLTKGNSSQLTIPPEQAPLFQDGFCEIHVVGIPNRKPSLFALGIPLNGEEVSAKK